MALLAVADLSLTLTLGGRCIRSPTGSSCRRHCAAAELPVYSRQGQGMPVVCMPYPLDASLCPLLVEGLRLIAPPDHPLAPPPGITPCALLLCTQADLAAVRRTAQAGGLR